MLRVKRGRRGVTYRLQAALVVEGINADAAQLVITLNAFDVDEIIAILRPKALLGG